MYVYRIEWPNGTGFYTGAKVALGILCPAIGSEPAVERHPLPHQDTRFMDEYIRLGWEGRAMELRWGFESLKSLRYWFYSDLWIRNMSDAGCLLCTYDVHDDTTVVGRTQVAFDSRVAKLVFKEPLINVLEKV